MKDFLTIEGLAEYGFEISRSSFVCRMAHTKNLAEGLEFVAGIKKKFSDATHNCYAIVGDPQSNEQEVFGRRRALGNGGTAHARCACQKRAVLRYGSCHKVLWRHKTGRGRA